MASSRAKHRKEETPGGGPSKKKTVREQLADPGFTPSVRRLGELLDLLLFDEKDDENDVAKEAERAVLRIELQYAARVAQEVTNRAASAVRPARGRLTHLAGRLAQEREKRDPEGLAVLWLIAALADADPKTRHAAARAIGKLEPRSLPSELKAKIGSALIEAFDRGDDEDKRALALSLGKLGGEAARARLEGKVHGDGDGNDIVDSAGEKNAALYTRAAVIAERDAARDESPGAIDVSQSPDAPVRVWFHTRSGLEDIVKEELADQDVRFEGVRFVAPGIVEARLDGPLSNATSLIRTAMHVGFPLTPFASSSSGDSQDNLAEDIVRGLTTPEALAIFRTFTLRELREPEHASANAPIRFRLSFTRGGHRRAVVWRCAELLRTKTRELVNDPKESTWEVLVNEIGKTKLGLELIPRAFTDERFAYRHDLVAASSHPTIAAALARVAPREDDDVVWDPFAGAGAELIERAILGPYARLIGTDTDAKAVLAANENVSRAGVLGLLRPPVPAAGEGESEDATTAPRLTIEQADASTYVPSGSSVNVIITNPPMGRRVQRGEHVDLLDRFVTHAAEVLAPGGVLVWMVPEPRRIRAHAEAEGFDVVRSFAVDMGGFSAELCVFSKRLKKGRAKKTAKKTAKAARWA